jgi:hypothetical protein
VVSPLVAIVPYVATFFSENLDGHLCGRFSVSDLIAYSLNRFSLLAIT